MLSLRRVEGLDIKSLKELSLIDNYASFTKQLKDLLRQGLVVEEGDKIKIPSDKLFISDGIIRDLFI